MQNPIVLQKLVAVRDLIFERSRDEVMKSEMQVARCEGDLLSASAALERARRQAALDDSKQHQHLLAAPLNLEEARMLFSGIAARQEELRQHEKALDKHREDLEAAKHMLKSAQLRMNQARIKCIKLEKLHQQMLKRAEIAADFASE